MIFDFEESAGKVFLKNFNLVYLSYALTTIFIIKVCFPANIDNSGYGSEKGIYLAKFSRLKKSFSYALKTPIERAFLDSRLHIFVLQRHEKC